MSSSVQKFKDQLIIDDSIDKKPIWFYMAFSATFVLFSFERMVSVGYRQRPLLLQQVNNRYEFIQRAASFHHQLEIFFEGFRIFDFKHSKTLSNP